MNQTVNEILPDDKLLLDLPINDLEIGTALKELASNKSPGGDGFTVNFYKFFWPDIKQLVIQSLKHAINRGHMSIEQKRAILALVPKGDKDIRYLKNWRPISLLNSDYKILAKLFANRLLQVIPYIISHDQSGCIKNRSTFDNIRSLTDIISFINENNKTGVIAFVDYEKAFDTVSWPFLYKCLQTFNFGDNFISYIKTLYNDIQTCVTNNGYSSRFFKPSRGIRQGCPISAMLFVLVVEILANAIRKNPRIIGITIKGMQWKIGQYADDTCLFMNDENSLSLALLLIELFAKASGLCMNRDKSEAIAIGTSSNYRHKVKQIKISTDSIRYLGILINADAEKMSTENFNLKLQKIENLIKIWACRYLTLKGKITIVNSLLITQMCYISSVIYTMGH